MHRSMGYSDSMMLQISKVDDADGMENASLPFESLNLQENYISRSAPGNPHQVRALACCGLAHKDDGGENGEYLRRVRRVTRAPAVFVVEINRRKPIMPVKEGSPPGPEPQPFMHRITECEVIDMSAWSNDAPTVAEKPYQDKVITAHEVVEGKNLDAKYQVMALSPITETFFIAPFF